MDYKYTSIDKDRRERPRDTRLGFLGAILIVAILSAALSSMATFIVMTSIKVEKHQQQFSCGETFDEAHQRGCTFDPLTLTWLHPKCSQFGQKEFLEISKTSSNGSWEYWEDSAGLHELGGYETLSYLSAGSSYYTTQEEHLHHCMWMLMRVHDAATNPGKHLDSKSGSYEHTKHCLEMLVEQAKLGAGDSLFQVNVEGLSMDIGWTAC